jgi:hypothetical protein
LVLLVKSLSYGILLFLMVCCWILEDLA